MSFIPYGRQDINQDDIDAVVRVLKSDFLTQGPEVPSFEKKFASRVQAKHALATTNATSALHLACLALGVGPGDMVWTSAVTFVASANCAVYCGAEVDFVDIDDATYNMSVADLERKLKLAKASGKLPKVVIPVHLTGQSCDMAAIRKLSEIYGFKVIEDASHAVGATYLQKPVGSCEFSDITVFSFHPVKIITTGEGGMLTTNNDVYSSVAYRLRSHGITRDQHEMTQDPDGMWFYQQLDLGFNYRMTEIQAALGASQLSRLDDFLDSRHSIASMYDEALSSTRFKRPFQDQNGKSAFHLYVVRVPSTGDIETRNQVFEKLRANGILVNLHYIPVYKHPFYAKFGYNSQEYPNAETYYREAISLPMFPTLKGEEIRTIVEVLNAPIGHQTIF